MAINVTVPVSPKWDAKGKQQNSSPTPQRGKTQHRPRPPATPINLRATRSLTSSQSLQQQNADLAQELEEKANECATLNRDAEELADLVRTKNGVVADLQKSLQEAKATIAELREELRHLRGNEQAEDEPRNQTATRVGTNSLETIHRRYLEVLAVLNENCCSMANAFRLSGCPRSTLRDFVAIAELRILDTREHDLVVSDWGSGSVKELEAACRRRLK